MLQWKNPRFASLVVAVVTVAAAFAQWGWLDRQWSW